MEYVLLRICLLYGWLDCLDAVCSWVDRSVFFHRYSDFDLPCRLIFVFFIFIFLEKLFLQIALFCVESRFFFLVEFCGW